MFKPTEVLMMLSAFSNIETIHIAAYSHLLDTIGMPEIEYQAFLKYKEMKDKYDYMQTFRVDSKHEIAKTLAAFGAFTEGLQLFASFAILLNFPRFGKMKGMGQIITWSVRDETLHCLSMIRLFRTFVQENPEIWTEELRRDIYITCATIVDHEDAFIDLAFELGAVEGLTARRGEAVHPLHRRPPADAARPEPAVPCRAQPAALARRDAERGRARQFLREPLHRIQQGVDRRHLGGGVFRPGVRYRPAQREHPPGRMMLRRIRWLAYGLIALVAIGWGALWLRQEASAPLLGGVSVPGGVSVGGPFTLVDDHGRTVTDASYRGRWMLVYFGYTFCPDVCPTELQTVSAALEKLGPAAARLVPLFITIDPGRDTPAALADYVKLFDERLVGLTGTEQQIAAVAREYRVYYAKANSKDASSYLMDHSSFLYLMGPDGKFQALFHQGTSPEELANAIRARIGNS